MKKFLFILSLALLFSCNSSEDSSPTQPIANTPNPLQVGNEWEYINSENHILEVRLDKIDSAVWSSSFFMNYYELDSNVNTYFFTFKFKEGNLPRIVDKGMYITDSSYLLGTKKHPMLNLDYQTDYFVPLFEIPKVFEEHKTVIDYSEYIRAEFDYSPEIYSTKDTLYESLNIQIDLLSDSPYSIKMAYENSYYFSKDFLFLEYEDYLINNIKFID